MGIKNNQKYFFSVDVLKRHLKELETNPKMGKFVIQQSEIQRLLFSLIFYRLAPHPINDAWVKKNKKLIEQIPDYTLGKLCQIYQPCTNQIIDEIKLLNKLKCYNNRRNKLVHKPYKVENDTSSDFMIIHWGNYAKYTNRVLIKL